MQVHSFVAKLILTIFVLAALFGIYGMVSLSHVEHGGCPSSHGQHSLCTTPLEHLGHWQSVFTAVCAEILILLAFVAIFSTSASAVVDAPGLARLKYHSSRPLRPPLLQELFSQGILHRKEPQIA